MKRGFTLIELLVVIAIIAILAAILFPVFAQAKAAAKTASSLSNVKQVALGSLMYSGDSDDVVVYYYGYDHLATDDKYLFDEAYGGRLFPYVKSQDLFFDTMGPKPQPDTVINGEKKYKDVATAGYNYSWSWITNLSINSDGYSMSGSGTCENPSIEQSAKSQTAIDAPADRIAFAPTQYGTNPYGWMYFRGSLASWPTSDVYKSGYNEYNLVWDSRKRFRTGKLVGSYADGHAAKFGREKFVQYFSNSANGTTEANTQAEYCTVLKNKKLDAFWGSAWTGN